MKNYLTFFYLVIFSKIICASTTIPAGDVSGIWTLSGSPYNIVGNISIPSDSTLTIESGVKVIFQTSNHYDLKVLGRIIAIGKPLQQIDFFAADSVAGFGGIRFNSLALSNDTSKLIFCNIKYGYTDPASSNGGGLYFKYWSKAIVENCTIMRCRSLYGNGGGMYCFASSPVITKNSFILNYTSKDGGGLSMVDCNSPVLTNNTFINDSAYEPSAIAVGGGLSLKNTINGIISGNTFLSNYASFGGGGVFFDSFCSLENNTFKNNKSGYRGGGIYKGGQFSTCLISDNSISDNYSDYQGGGIYCSAGYEIKNNVITNNFAGHFGGAIFSEVITIGFMRNNQMIQNSSGISGGAVYLFYSASDTSKVYFSGNVVSANSAVIAGGGLCNEAAVDSLFMENNLFTNNSVTNTSSGKGGAIYFKTQAKDFASIINCSIVNNNALLGGGIYVNDTMNTSVIKNTIMWGNSAAAGHEIYLNDEQSDPNFYYCAIENGSTDFGLNGNIFTGAYQNNITSNPQFIAPSPGAGATFIGTYDWSLQALSPCRNAGDPLGAYSSFDLLNNPRVYENVIDLGAIEFQTSVAITKTAVSCFNGANGTATVTPINGTAPYTYSWSDGQTTATATGLVAGNYSVTITDSLNATASTNVVISQPAPLLITGTPFPASCANGDGSAIVFASGGTSPYFYSWSNGDSLSAIAFLDSGVYTIQVTDTNGCVAVDSLTIFIDYSILPQAPKICFISVDSTSTNNVIYWEKPGGSSNIESYYVYRDTANNNYALIGIVPFDSLAQFIDTVRYLYPANGDPQASSWRYKIAIKDVCGNISPKSPFHQTLFFQDNSGNFTWSEYKIEGETLPVPQLQSYRFYRDNLSNGNWVLIQTLSASSTSYTDVNYAAYPSGQWRVNAFLNSSCNISQRIAGYSTSRSNIKNRNSVAIQEASSASLISLSPNPANEFCILTTSQAIEYITVYDAFGRIVLYKRESNPLPQSIKINLIDFAAGVYTVLCKGDNFEVRKKLVVKK